MLLGCCERTVSLEEDLNLSPTIQFPVNLDMEKMDMFPVAELSDLINTDFSFLDDYITEDNQHTEIKNMTDLSTVEGSSCTEIQALSAGWLSGNVGLETLIGEQSFLQSTEPSHVFYPNASGASFVNYPGVTAESSNIFGIDSITDISLFTERLGSDERIYSSSDESTRKQTEVHHAMSPLVSESEEIIIEHNDKDDSDGYSIAGKKYLQMRQKNNIASQRSRKLRKQKNLDMTVRLKTLAKENKELKMLAADLEKQRDALQRQLLQIISKK